MINRKKGSNNIDVIMSHMKRLNKPPVELSEQKAIWDEISHITNERLATIELLRFVYAQTPYESRDVRALLSALTKILG